MKDHISNTKLEKRRSLLHPNTAQRSLFVSRKFYPDFEYEKITSLNLRLSLVLLLSHCFLDDARGKHFAEVSNSRDNV